MKRRVTIILSVILVMTLLTVSVMPVCAESVTALNDPTLAERESKMDDGLAKIVDLAGEEDTICVALWLKGPDDKEREAKRIAEYRSINFESIVEKEKQDIIKCSNGPFDEDKIEKIAAKQADHTVSNNIERELIKQNNETIIRSLKSTYKLESEFTYISRYTPLAFAELRKNDILQIKEDRDIVKMYYVSENEYSYTDDDAYEEDDPSVPSYGLWQSITGIEALRNNHGDSGLGIKIGHIEGKGVPDKLDAIFNYTRNNITIIGTNPNHNHATYTAGLLVGKTSDYYGAAFNSRLYCNSFKNTDPEYSSYNYYTKRCKIIESILDQDVNILNASAYFGDALPYDCWSAFLDYIVCYYHTTVCISAGNTNDYDAMQSGAVAYNVITVGNIDDKNTLNTNVYIFYHTLFLNSNSLQYKPDICAPGKNAKLPPITDGLRSGGGTSAAAAIVSGVCAMLMEEETDLMDNPMLMKSVLLSSAQRITNMDHQTTTWYSTLPALSHQYGAGMVNAVYASQLVSNNRYNSFTESDWIGNSYITIDIPYYTHDLNNQRRIYASICWEELIDKTISTSYNANTFTPHNTKRYYIELLDPDNDVVSSSIYEYDRKQVLGYQPIVAGTYKLRITKYWLSNDYSNLSVSYSIPIDY